MRQMLLHTEAFEHICLSTQKHLPRDALTYTRLYTQKLLDTDCFSENHRGFDTEKPLHREPFTHRSFYTHKRFHRAFTQRSFWAQELLRTDAFTHRSLYTQTLSHRKTDSTEQLLHTSKKSHFYVNFWPSAIISCERVASGVGKSPFLRLANHFAWKGCAWPCKIAILHKSYFARNGCAWRFKMDKVAILHQFLNVCIWR